MIKASVVAMVIACALVGCKKKEEGKAEPPAGSAMAGSDTAGSAATGDTAGSAATGDTAGSAATGDTAGSAAAGSAAAAGSIEDVKPVPDGMPADCTKAYDLMVKYRACDAQPADARAQMIKAWNAAVDGTFVHYKTAQGDTKATIEKTCTSMAQNGEMLVKGC